MHSIGSHLSGNCSRTMSRLCAINQHTTSVILSTWLDLVQSHQSILVSCISRGFYLEKNRESKQVQASCHCRHCFTQVGQVVAQHTTPSVMQLWQMEVSSCSWIKVVAKLDNEGEEHRLSNSHDLLPITHPSANNHSDQLLKGNKQV